MRIECEELCVSVCLRENEEVQQLNCSPIQIVEEETKKGLEENKRSLAALDALNTDEKNDEEEYEAWKVRELKKENQEGQRRQRSVSNGMSF